MSHTSNEASSTDSESPRSSITSATILDSEPTARPKSSNVPLSHISAEAPSIISNGSNYIALGCLCCQESSYASCSPSDGSITSTWQRLTSLVTTPLDTPAFADLRSLLFEGWVNIEVSHSLQDPRWLIFRIYVLPHDVGLRHIDRRSRNFGNSLERLVCQLDISSETWAGQYRPGNETRFDVFAFKDEGSLFYMFNKIPSPAPSPQHISKIYAREALEDLLDVEIPLGGLKTQLYPYQRRSAGLMLERESSVKLDLDPRLEARTAPDGTQFFFGPWDFQFFKESRFFEASRGGILAESMGLGKTVICLALILATKNHPPEIPAAYAMPTVRERVGTLTDMAVAAINLKSIPWKVEFERIRHASGDDLRSCVNRIEDSPPQYKIPVDPVRRWNRSSVFHPPSTMTTAATTLIVVPPNLYKQWQSEIVKHVEQGALRVFFVNANNSKKELPDAAELRTYDVILFSRSRLEAEDRDGADEQGRRMSSVPLTCRCPYIGASRIRDCTCLTRDMVYESPLKQLHFKRLIVDEGHFFTNANTRAMGVVNKLIKADHRWIVSGTPAKDLLGVEVEMSVTNIWTGDSQVRDSILEQRRYFSVEDTKGAIDSLGSLLSNFLKLEPWSIPNDRNSGAAFKDYIFRHEAIRKRTFAGYSQCLQRILHSVVVKTQPEDVERDIQMPPLTHKIVPLKPSFYDKLTANLFTLVLTANAVTSERTDIDYLFHNHRDSRKARYQLITNLRQSAFFWTGFSESDVLASIKSSTKYLEKDNTCTNCSAQDRKLLLDALACTETILASSGWKSMSRTHEMGVFVDGFPDAYAEHWSFQFSQPPASSLLTGISQLLQAQDFVNQQLHRPDPGEGLAGEGLRALAPARVVQEANNNNSSQSEANRSILTKAGIPASSLSGEPLLSKRQSSPKKAKLRKADISKRQKSFIKIEHSEDSASLNQSNLPSGIPGKPEYPPNNVSTLPIGSPYAACSIVGTTSAKMSYLISAIMKYQHEEKILVFYEGDNVAYYISQILDLLHIKHEIYARSLNAALKSTYVVRFDQEADDRVLLMDVKQAAFGLNISSASRIFFVNPVCRPNIEAQAIKRAHRIGQTRHVHVETLVLSGTIEEKMLERSKRMTIDEHRDAKDLEDDVGIRQIIESARTFPICPQEQEAHEQMSPLREAQKLWCRPGWREFNEHRTASLQGTGSRKRKRDDPDHKNDVASGTANGQTEIIPDHSQVIQRRRLTPDHATNGRSNGIFQDSQLSGTNTIDIPLVTQ